MRHRSVVTVLLMAALLGAACESSTEPSAVHLTLVAPDTVHGTIRVSNDDIHFLECIYPVRIQATGPAADSAVWLDGYWGFAPLGSNVVHASNTMSADELSDWSAFGASSIRAGAVQSWNMWFGFVPTGYWVEGYFTYASGRRHTRGMLNYRFVCVP